MLDQARPTGDAEDEALARAICASHGNDPAELIEILHDLQDARGCVPEAVQPVLAEALNIGRAEVHGVMSFYHDFRNAPAAGLRIHVCRAEACQARGALPMIEAFCARRGLVLDGPAKDGVEIASAFCLGDCALGPAARIDGRLHGRLTPDRLDALTDRAQAAKEAAE